MISSIKYGCLNASKQRSERFGAATALPWDVYLAQNQLLNRFVLEAVGVLPWRIGLSRNNFERLEHSVNVLNFWTLGIVLPLLLEYGINRRYGKGLIKKFKLQTNAKPLAVPFEFLEHHQYKKLVANKDATRILQAYGIPSVSKFTPQLRDAIFKGKNAFILVDLTLMAVKGVGIYIFRNWMTEKLTNKKGFVGIMDYANDKYREKMTEKYQKQKKKRMVYSTLLGLVTSFAFPVLFWQTIKSPSKVGQGLWGKLKPLIPKFNYSNTLFMSKWLLFYSAVFHYNIPKFAFARDKHELREALTHAAIFDFFYFIGDDVFAGIAAKKLNKMYKHKLKGIHLYKENQRLGMKIPTAIPYHEIFNQVGKNPKHIAFKLARKAFWIGFAGTTLCLSIALPLMNIWYTKQKVLREQDHMKSNSPRKFIQPAINNLYVKPIPQIPTPQQYLYPSNILSKQISQ